MPSQRRSPKAVTPEQPTVIEPEVSKVEAEQSSSLLKVEFTIDVEALIFKLFHLR